MKTNMIALLVVVATSSFVLTDYDNRAPVISNAPAEIVCELHNIVFVKGNMSVDDGGTMLTCCSPPVIGWYCPMCRAIVDTLRAIEYNYMTDKSAANRFHARPEREQNIIYKNYGHISATSRSYSIKRLRSLLNADSSVPPK